MYVYVYMLTVRVFYHDERILSVIAKFLVHFLGKGREWLKWERGELEKEFGGNGEGEWEYTKKYPQNATYLAFRDSLGGYRPVPYILDRYFHAQHLPRR